MISRLFAAAFAATISFGLVVPASAGTYDSLIAKHAKTYGVPVGLAKAVVRIESNYRPNARGKAGEIGLMQVKLSTARGLGYTGSAKGLYNPDTNLRYGMKYLGMAHKLGGKSTCGTILRYNAGHGAKRMNPVSAAYCSKVKRVIGSGA
jgi:soluble lytic murein transglycosylase-like protein